MGVVESVVPHHALWVKHAGNIPGMEARSATRKLGTGLIRIPWSSISHPTGKTGQRITVCELTRGRVTGTKDALLLERGGPMR